MDNCNYYKEMINDYIDDCLNDQDKQKLLAHLEICPECREEYEQLKIILSELSELEADLPEGFEDELHDKLLDVNKEKKAFSKLKFYRMGVSIAACTLIVFSLGIFLNNSKSDLSDSLDKNTENSDYYISENINTESDGSIDIDSEERGMIGAGSANDDPKYKERENIIVQFNSDITEDYYEQGICEAQITASVAQNSKLEVLVCIDTDKEELDTFVKELLEEYDYKPTLKNMLTFSEKPNETDQNEKFSLTVEIKTDQLEDFINELTIKYPNLTLEVPDNIDSEFVYVIISTKDE